MTIKSWPTRERPREKLLDAGAGALGDGELLAAILGTGTRGENAHELAMRLLAEFGGLHGLDEAGMHDILSVRGMGAARAALIKAALELGRRTIYADKARARIAGSADLNAAVSGLFHNLDREMLLCVFLDGGLRLIGHSVISAGGGSGCAVDLRLLLKEALSKGASSVALAHNHPSGECRPSSEDEALTMRAEKSLECVGIKLIDHLIVCGCGKYFSFADKGLLDGGVRQDRRPLLQSSSGRQPPWSPCRP